MKLKALYQRFRAWQLEPYKYEILPGEIYQCANCGHSFEGGYCPACGQRNTVGPVHNPNKKKKPLTLRTLIRPGSLISFLMQLFGRSGYMISDYLKGRKKNCGSPIDMLCYVAVAAMLVNKFFGDADTNKTLSLEGVNGVLGIILGWLASNLDWAVLIQTILVILPTWLLFRYAPKHPRHTLVEGFFIQAFMGSLVLICIMLRALISDKVLSLIPVIYYIAYRQLFGYGIWATLWRTLLTLGIILYFFAVLMMAVKYFQGDFSEVQSTGISLVMVGILFAAGIAVFLLGWWIGKRTESKG